MKKLMVLLAALVAGVTLLSFPVRAAADGDAVLLVAPARYTVMQVAFDVARRYPTVLVSYQSGAFLQSYPSRTFLLGDDALLPASLRNVGAWCKDTRQMRDLEAPGFHPARKVVADFLAWISGPALRARHSFLVSHDCHIAYLMNGLGVANFTIDDWVGFLQGCALFEQTDGTWTAEHIVPDKANHHSRFVY